MKHWLRLTILLLITGLAHASPLPASEVFQVNVKPVDPNTFMIEWNIKPGYFLYKKRIHLENTDNANFDLAEMRFPQSQTKVDKQGRTIDIYREKLLFPVSVLGINPGESLLKLKFQGCSDDGFCYPPEQRTIKIAINPQLAIFSVTLEDNNEVASTSEPSPQNSLDSVFANHHWLVALLVFYGFGLLLSFTPCILPMVPVLSGIIVGHGANLTTRKAFLLSLSYVLSMSLTYAIVGAVIALLGANIQLQMQSPWVISIFSFIFVMLALSMFGFYEFKLPQAWQRKIAGGGQTPRGGHYWGAAVMGMLSTLILSPCVTAPLIGVLTYIAKSGDMILGFFTLFILGLGMGTPLLVIGTSAGKWLPSAGNWMNALKASFGVIFLAVAIYLLSRIITGSVSMALWAFLLIFSGIYSGALNYASSHIEKFCQGIGLILLGYGVLILIGCSMGNTNPLQPLSGIRHSAVQSLAVQHFKNQNLASLEHEINTAVGMPIMLDFYADWCASCKVMDETTLKNPQVQNSLSAYKTIKIDITKDSAANRTIMKHFKVIAPPTYIFLNASGKEEDSLRIVGEVNPQEFLKSTTYR